MSELVRRVRRNLKGHGLLPQPPHLLVAVSGGCDSMVLLTALHSLSESLGLRLTVAHARHQLRGEASEADAELVATAARELKLPFISRPLPVRESQRQTKESMEMTARRLRHRFLAESAREVAATHVAVAHHADDQVEGILLRLVRGAGGDGLGGMPWKNESPFDRGITLVRPMLDFTRDELRSFARATAVSFREDLSNADPEILRNRVRHELRPFLESRFNPSLSQTLHRTAQIIGAEAEYVALEAERWLAAEAPRPPFEQLHVAVQRAIIRQQLWQLGDSGYFDAVERLRESLSPTMVTGRTRLVRDPSGLLRPAPSRPQLSHASRTVRMSPGARRMSRSLGGTRVQIAIRDARHRRIPPEPSAEQFDAETIVMPVTLRHWAPGDRFRPLGFPRPAKVQDLLVNRKIPAARRRELVLAADATGEIFWIEGLPPGERFKLTPRTRRILTLNWRPPR